MKKAKKAITQEIVKDLYKEIQQTEDISKMLKNLLDYGRKHNFYQGNVESYINAKKCVLEYIKYLRRYKKDIIKDIYIEEL